MKNKMRLSLVGLVMFTSQISFAQSEVGHGGNSYVCFKSVATKTQVESILRDNEKHPMTPNDPLTPAVLAQIAGHPRLLDFYELTFPTLDGTVPIISSKDTYKKILDERIVLMKQKNILGYILSDIRDSYLQYGHFQMVPSGVVMIDDSQHTFIPKANCLVVQTAVQKDVGGETYVSIDSRIFNRMSNIDQAGLINHEWMIYFARFMLHQNSPSPIARKFNQLLFEERFAAMTSKDFADEIYNLDSRLAVETVTLYSVFKPVSIKASTFRNQDGSHSNDITLEDKKVDLSKKLSLTVPAGSSVNGFTEFGFSKIEGDLQVTFEGQMIATSQILNFDAMAFLFVPTSPFFYKGMPVAVDIISISIPVDGSEGALSQFMAGADFEADGYKVKAGQSVYLTPEGHIERVVSNK